MINESTRAAEFPSLEGRAYLNTAAEGIPPLSVLEALRQYGQDRLLGMDGRELHAVKWERAKSSLGKLLGFDAAEVTLCSCSSEAYNLAYGALRLRDGDEVVVNDLDFPAGVTPFMLADAPVQTKVWRSRPDGALYPEDLRTLLSPRTRFVQLSLVSFLNGFRIDLAAVAREVRKLSPALIGVDVTQALCRIPLELRDADLVISSTHKWLLASHGGGIVAVPARLGERLTVRTGGWFNLEEAFAPDRFDRAAKPRSGAAGYTVGMPNYPAVYAVAAAADYMLGVGIASIEDYARPLVAQVLRELVKVPEITLLTPTREPSGMAGIVAFRHPRAQALHARMRAANVHIMHHAGRLRVTIHGYNTSGDIEAFLRALHEGLKDV